MSFEKINKSLSESIKDKIESKDFKKKIKNAIKSGYQEDWFYDEEAGDEICEEYFDVKDLKIGSFYHIKNNYADNISELWFNNSKLIDIKEEWAEPTMLTFMLENGKEIVIDADFVSKKSGKQKSEKRYQIIEVL